MILAEWRARKMFTFARNLNPKAGMAGGTFIVSTTDQKSSLLVGMVHAGN